MKRSDVFYGVLSLITLIVISSVAYVRFVDTAPGFAIDDIEQVQVEDDEGQMLPLAALLEDSTDFLLLELENCGTCIYKGTEELETRKKSGRRTMILVVNDWKSEVESWSLHYDQPVYRISRADFLDYFSAQLLPVIGQFKGEKVHKYRFITP